MAPGYDEFAQFPDKRLEQFSVLFCIVEGAAYKYFHGSLCRLCFVAWRKVARLFTKKIRFYAGWCVERSGAVDNGDNGAVADGGRVVKYDPAGVGEEIRSIYKGSTSTRSKRHSHLAHPPVTKYRTNDHDLSSHPKNTSCKYLPGIKVNPPAMRMAPTYSRIIFRLWEATFPFRIAR